MLPLVRSAKWQRTMAKAQVGVRSREHQSQLLILPLQCRMIVTRPPVPLLKVIEANKAIDKLAGIRGVEEVVKKGARVGDAVTNAVDVIRRIWAVLNGGTSLIYFELTLWLTEKSESSGQAETQRGDTGFQTPKN
jgi:hypothetical protein